MPVECNRTQKGCLLAHGQSHSEFFKILSRKQEWIDLKVQTNALGKASGSVREKKVIGEVWERPAAVDEGPRYVTYLYLQLAKIPLKSYALYTELMNWENLVRYGPQRLNVQEYLSHCLIPLQLRSDLWNRSTRLDLL